MIKLTADCDLQIKDLARFLDPVEISDADGKLIGLFVPANLERGRQIYANLTKNLDRAEMDRRAADDKPSNGWQVLLKRMKEASGGEQANGTVVPVTSITEGKECVTP